MNINQTRPTGARTGLRPICVEDPEAAIRKLSQETNPGQAHREVLENARLAIKRTGVPGRIHIYATEHHGVPKLTYADTGDGFGPDMATLLSALYVAGASQATDDTLGLGGKIGVAATNPAGVEYHSWQAGASRHATMHRDTEGRHGLLTSEVDGEWVEIFAADEALRHPDITEHGTVVILHGTDARHDTTARPADARPDWLANYFNSRYLGFGDVTVTTSVGAGSDVDAAVEVRGGRYYLDAHSDACGAVELPGATVSWWLLSEGAAKAQAPAPLTGQVAMVLGEEVYERYDGLRATSALFSFGVAQGTSRVALMVRVHGVTTDSARSRMLIPSQQWAAWGKGFAQNMPKALSDHMARVTATQDDNTRSTLARLKKTGLIAPAKRRAKVPSTTSRTGGTSSSSTDIGGGDSMSWAGPTAPSIGQTAGLPAPRELSERDLPRIIWTDHAQLEARDPLREEAAHYSEALRHLHINRSFDGFDEIVDLMHEEYPNIPDPMRTTLIERYLRRAVECHLIAAILSIEATPSGERRNRSASLAGPPLTAVALVRGPIVADMRKPLGEAAVDPTLRSWHG